MKLLRSHYHLAYHGMDNVIVGEEIVRLRVWIFKGPVDVKMIEWHKGETTAEAFHRLVELLENNDWEFGESPASFVNERAAGEPVFLHERPAYTEECQERD